MVTYVRWPAVNRSLDNTCSAVSLLGENSQLRTLHTPFGGNTGISDSNLMPIVAGRVASKWVTYLIGLCLAILQAPSLCFALSIEFDYGLGFPVGSPARAALEQAASAWETVLADPVTVRVQAAFGSTTPYTAFAVPSDLPQYDYASVRQALVQDRTSLQDVRAVTSLETGLSFNFIIDPIPNTGSRDPQQQGYRLLRGGNSSLETSLRVYPANAKALGVPVLSQPHLDGFITFDENPGVFDFERADGIKPGRVDFVGVAQHELGHVLGFDSGVGFVDSVLCHPTDKACAQPVQTLAQVKEQTYFMPLDLYRYSPLSRELTVDLGVPVRDLSVTAIRFGPDTFQTRYFSLNNGATEIAQFSIGEVHGDGFQEGHWKIRTPALMAPGGQFSGRIQNISVLDLFAFDAIGWDVRPFIPVGAPEPGALWLFGSGFVGLAAWWRKYAQSLAKAMSSCAVARVEQGDLGCGE
jgi:hypothetical protein